MTEVKKETVAAKPKADKDGNFKIENIGKRNLNLTSGQIEPGKTGKATAAECGTLYNFLKVL